MSKTTNRPLRTMPKEKVDKCSTNSETEKAYKERTEQLLADMTASAGSLMDVDAACKELQAYVTSKAGDDPMAADKGTWKIAVKKGGGGCLIL
mmetsp:Transcript_33529/g.98532  ORF Transcript_33529/g.98532 Transcript_33529/m.98532 type:complete len:93 (-) Transcript_33529:571-849(-)